MKELVVIEENKSLPLRFYLLLFGLALLLFQHYLYAIPVPIQWLFFATTMALTGIPHGAMDHLVDEQNRIEAHKSFSLTHFLSQYLLRMGVYGLLWWIFPLLAFAVFIAISAYHFGEADLAILSRNKKAEKLLFFSYGWLLLSILLLSHKELVIEVLASLPHFLEGAARVVVLISEKYEVIYFSACGAWLLGSFIYYYLQAENYSAGLLLALLQGIILALICIGLPLLLSFSFYFGMWHSILCIQSIRLYLIRKEGGMSWNKLIRKAAFFSVLALLGIALLIIVFSHYDHPSDLLLWLFVGISILTAPHIGIMSSMFVTLRSPQKGLA